jgi:murein L,D-transpeptidase YcbB/YkuD
MGGYPKAEWLSRFRLSGASIISFLIAFALIALVCMPARGQEAISTQAALRIALTAQSNSSSNPLFEFYFARDFRPAWSGSDRSEQDAQVVMSVLAHATSQGLDASHYAGAASRWQAAPPPGDEAAAYDIYLTADLLRYASDVRQGQLNPRQVYKDVSLPVESFDAAETLNQALINHRLEEFLVDLPPPHPEYRALAAALSRYRLIAGGGGWPVVPGTGEISLTEKSTRLNTLVLRLSLEDTFLAGQVDPASDTIAEALMRFQTRNGIAADGRAGPATLAALNVPVQARIGQIIANMERWRWLPQNFEPRTVRVNVPDQTLQLVENGSVLLSSVVGVGRPSSRTPIVRMVAEDLVVNPPWDVPDDIAASQILPHLKREPNYLAAHNMVLENGPAGDPHGLKVNWSKVTSLPYLIDQAPGPDSAMGVLMFDSPNDFGVYLHDTPGKGIFKADMRQVSNGCIRVEQMFPLTSLVLSGDRDSALDSLKLVIADRQTARINLDDPLPVYLLYWTAIADEDGMVGFRPDFYGRDRPLLVALDAVSATPSAVSVLDQSPIARIPS